MDLALVHSVLAALCPPIYGVSVGNPSDLTAWEILRDGAGTWMPLDTTALPVAESPVMTSALSAPDLTQGLSITFTANSALSGTYPVDPTTQQNLASVSIYITVNSKFPAGQTTISWQDINGNPHSGFTTSQFQAFASAIADYVAAVDLARGVLGIGNPVNWPSASITI
jgi:hypothetical protein